MNLVGCSKSEETIAHVKSWFAAAGSSGSTTGYDALGPDGSAAGVVELINL